VTCMCEVLCERMCHNQRHDGKARPDRTFQLERQRMRNKQEDSPERTSRLEGWSFLEQQSCDSHAYFTDINIHVMQLPTKLQFGVVTTCFSSYCSDSPHNVISTCLVVEEEIEV